MRAEGFKLRTLWSTYVLVGMTAVASGLLGLAIGLAPHRREIGVFPPRGTIRWFDNLFSAMTIAQDFALVLGILMVTGEYRHKTITPTVLGEPRRERITSAKLVVAAGSGVVVAVSAGVAGLILGAAMVAGGYGNSVEMLTEFRHAFPGVLAAAVLFAVYGVGLGALLRNQVVALVVGLGVSAIVEPIIVGVWPTVGRWLPSQAAQSLESVTASATARGGFGSGFAHLLPSWEGALVLLGYGVVLAAAGSFTVMRADIT
jgi:hypothetical protein